MEKNYSKNTLTLFVKPYIIYNVLYYLSERDKDIISIEDEIIDIGPDGGTKGGEVVFTGTPKEMIENAKTITAKHLRK